MRGAFQVPLIRSFATFALPVPSAGAPTPSLLIGSMGASILKAPAAAPSAEPNAAGFQVHITPLPLPVNTTFSLVLPSTERVVRLRLMRVGGSTLAARFHPQLNTIEGHADPIQSDGVVRSMQSGRIVRPGELPPGVTNMELPPPISGPN